MVVFSGLEFIFRFLPVFLLIYYITPRKYRNAVLFIGSMVFYAVGEPHFVVLLLGLCIADYLLGRGAARRGKSGAVFLFLSILLNGGVLVGFKAAQAIQGGDLLPIGLSFYIFKMLSYEGDLYTGRIRETPRFIDAAAYFTMFPQITEGPIMRYSTGFGEGAHGAVPGGHIVHTGDVEDGLSCFVIGLSMKVLLADRLELLWTRLSTIGYASISTPLAWIGAYTYTFELYFDFWGYSMMAAGLAMMLGFPFVRNFAHPYASRSVTAFYRDWHVTLGEWFRDYLYFPLGGSRQGAARTIFNLFVVWVITGLWHGGTLNYVLWSMVLFLLIVWEKFVVKKLLRKFPFLGHLHVWILIPLTWVIFAITDLGQLGTYFTRLFPFVTGASPAGMAAGDWITYLRIFWPYFVAGIVLCIPKVSHFVWNRRRNPVIVILLAVLFWISIYVSANAGSNAFMYFDF
jgi:alginate O-acetyltransferase complex protein AlgI